LLAVIRIRGNAKVRKSIADTLKMLNLNSVNNCVVIPENESYKNMLIEVQNFVTYGEIKKEVFQKLLLKWGRSGNKRIDEKYFRDKKYTVEKFIDDFFEKKIKLKDLRINPVFRLHPPRGGYESIKKPYTLKGSLGYRGEKINKLLERMI